MSHETVDTTTTMHMPEPLSPFGVAVWAINKQAKKRFHDRSSRVRSIYKSGGFHEAVKQGIMGSRGKVLGSEAREKAKLKAHESGLPATHSQQVVLSKADLAQMKDASAARERDLKRTAADEIKSLLEAGSWRFSN